MPTVNSAVDLAAWINDPLRRIVAHLAKNDMADSLGNLDLTNLVECDFAGYEPQDVENWVMDEESTDVAAHATADAVEFTAGNVIEAQVPTIIYYTEVYNGGSPALYAWFPLDVVFPIDTPGQTITQNPEAWAADMS